MSNELKTQLAKYRAEVDAALDQALPSVEARPSHLHEAMRYAVLSGGKRLRPVLCLAAAEVVGGHRRKALYPAMALEVLHAYTLVHDDLPCMDDDDERRGKPTCHVTYGEGLAVLAGDALQTLAFELVARAEAPPPYGPTDLVMVLAGAAGSTGVVGGQVEDIAAENRRPDLETLSFVHDHKTADLFRAAMRLGVISGGGTPAELDAATAYGLALGRAFQITDDLLDAGEEVEGALPELSCLALYTEEEARDLAARRVAEAHTALAGLNGPQVAFFGSLADFVLTRTI